MGTRGWLALALCAACSSLPTTQPDAAVDASVSDVSVSDVTGKDVSPSDAGITCPALPIIDAEQIVKGTPSWRLAELQLFTTDVGDFNDASAFNNAISSIVGPKHVFDNAKNLFKSAYAHDPPYDTEIEAGLPATGFTNSGCFELSDLTSPKGIAIAANLVPSQTAATGISFEQPDGGKVIQPGDLTLDGDLYVDNALVDPNFDTTFPKVNFVYDYPKIALDGWGHLLMNWCENQAVSPAQLTAGSYRFEIRISDMFGNETLDIARFGVK
jgi:hypothetical protein